MSRRLIVVLILLAIIASGGLFLYGYLYKEARDISTEEALHELKAQQLAREYANSPDLANTRYLNSTIEVSGTVTEVSGTDIILDSVVFCSFNNGRISAVQGSPITIKGRCIGYDELFGEVKLDQCTIKE